MANNEIHPSAAIADDVELGEGNRIGPGVIIESGCKLGNENVLWPNAYLGPNTTLGDRNQVHMGAVLGHEPQDKDFDGAPSYTIIGSDNVFREYCTVHRGTGEGTKTTIGDRNFFMAYTHIAHNCKIGSEVILVNTAGVAGHCEVDDKAQMSGLTALHQFVRLGKLSFLSALSGCNKDLPPFCIGYGRPAVVVAVNRVGLRRAGYTQEQREEIKEAFKLIYLSGLVLPEALAKIEEKFDSEPIKELVRFCRESKRGICVGMRQDSASGRTRDFEN